MSLLYLKDGCTNLYADSILSCSPELFDFEVLLQPFVEQFYLPPVLIQVSHFESRQMSRICQETKVAILLCIMVADKSEPFRVLLERGILNQLYLRICKYIRRKPPLPFHTLVLQISLGSYYEERFHPMDSVEFPEGIVTTVRHAVRALLIGNLVHCL